MKYALIIAIASLDAKHQALSSYAYSIEQKHPDALGISTLNAGAHLCDLKNGLSGLCLLLHEAKDQNIPVQVLFSEKEFSFVHS